MGNEINKAHGQDKPLWLRLAKAKADQVRAIDQRPKGFWQQVVYDYIVHNPGCLAAEAARSVEPHRSSGLGSKIVSGLIDQGWITRDSDNSLTVTKDRQSSKKPWVESWDDPL